MIKVIRHLQVAVTGRLLVPFTTVEYRMYKCGQNLLKNQVARMLLQVALDASDNKDWNPQSLLTGHFRIYEQTVWKPCCPVINRIDDSSWGTLNYENEDRKIVLRSVWRNMVETLYVIFSVANDSNKAAYFCFVEQIVWEMAHKCVMTIFASRILICRSKNLYTWKSSQNEQWIMAE